MEIPVWIPLTTFGYLLGIAVFVDVVFQAYRKQDIPPPPKLFILCMALVWFILVPVFLVHKFLAKRRRVK